MLLFSMEISWIQPKHTQCRPDYLAMTGILIGAALEADGEDGEDGHVAHCWNRLSAGLEGVRGVVESADSIIQYRVEIHLISPDLVSYQCGNAGPECTA